MSISSNIRKILFISTWCVLGAGILVLLIAAIRVKKDTNCGGYTIQIRSAGEDPFIDKEDIAKLLTENGSFEITGRSLKSFDLKKMEERLEKNAWINDAELFFDNEGLLKVKIIEREPIARVFTAGGNSFYIDSNCTRLPLSEKLSARVPVFTGFPSDNEKFSKADRLLLQHIKRMSQYILSNSFWMAQVSQVDVNASRQFEVIPTIGDHIIEFGDGTDCEKKFRRLLIFYQQIISKTGFAIYERVKVQYAGQVVGVRHAAAISRYDSLQAIKNVEKLIAMAQTEQERMMRMDSVEVSRMQHRTDNDQSSAKMSDTLSLKPEHE
jgi:cell division protein FtsQ